MDDKLLAVIIGFVLGAIGYWFTTFQMQPILKYRDIRNQILVDFIYFAQVVNAEGYNDEMKKLFRERILANRKASAQLSAAVQELPYWYLLYLKLKGQDPEAAARNHLIGYSNTTDYDQADKVENFIRRKLGLPPKT
ncbi:MAG: hypothetical protein M0Q44_14545 [Methylobacter sp.]|jgi:hypothetical protein|nr:hypothetical protein [Methylobacter sp.]